MIKKCQVTSFTECIFRVSYTNETKGWVGSQRCRMLLDNGQPRSFVPSELRLLQSGCTCNSLGKTPKPSKAHQAPGWHFPIHSCLFLSSISHHYSHL